MIRFVIQADKDGDMRIDLREAEKLKVSLSIQMETHGVILDTELFHEMLLEDNSVENIVRFCSMVLYPEIALKNDKEKKLLNDDLSHDDGDVLASESTRRKSKTPSENFTDFIRKASTLTDEQFKEVMKLTVEEKLGMISISDKYSQGAVEVARGRKVTILPMAPSERITIIHKVTKESHERCKEVERRVSKRITVLQSKRKATFARSNTSAEF